MRSTKILPTLALVLGLVVAAANGNLTLPYYGTISTAGKAFRVSNTYEGGGTSYGGFFYAAGQEGRGVFGQSAGSEGTGVKGWASNDGHVENYGGHFCATGEKGIGVYGWAENTGDIQNYGGFFLAEGNKGIGLFATGGPHGLAGEFGGDVKLTGAGNGIIFPDGTKQITAGTGAGVNGIYNKPIWPMLDKEFVDWERNPRFAVCNDGTPAYESDDMVHDKETGLIWARDAGMVGILSWSGAIYSCRQQIALGKRYGWRLPTIEELASLVDFSVDLSQVPYTTLPSGHPFINVPSTGGSSYWSSTVDESDIGRSYCLRFTQWDRVTNWEYESPVALSNKMFRAPHDGTAWAWPVRGGSGVKP